jgi:hypothetical protein
MFASPGDWTTEALAAARVELQNRNIDTSRIAGLHFGREAWPSKTAPRELPREARAIALLDEATKLESHGRVKEALAKYQAVVEKFRGTPASDYAQKSIESLRAKIG